MKSYLTTAIYLATIALFCACMSGCEEDSPELGVIHMDDAPQVDSTTTDCPVNLQDYCLIDNHWVECPNE